METTNSVKFRVSDFLISIMCNTKNWAFFPTKSFLNLLFLSGCECRSPDFYFKHFLNTTRVSFMFRETCTEMKLISKVDKTVNYPSCAFFFLRFISEKTVEWANHYLLMNISNEECQWRLRRMGKLCFVLVFVISYCTLYCRVAQHADTICSCLC